MPLHGNDNSEIRNSQASLAWFFHWYVIDDAHDFCIMRIIPSKAISVSNIICTFATSCWWMTNLIAAIKLNDFVGLDKFWATCSMRDIYVINTKTNLVWI